MRTAVPGPRSVTLKKELNTVQEMSSVTFFANYNDSFQQILYLVLLLILLLSLSGIFGDLFAEI